MTTAEAVFARVKALPEPMAREVLDFVEFLAQKQERGPETDLMHAQASSLAGIWDNPEDDAYNDA